MEQDKEFRKLAEELCDLHDRKNHDYGNAFGNSFEEFGLVVSVIRINDKLNRLKTLCKNSAEVKDEPIEDTLIDIAAYALMTVEEMHKHNDK